MFPEEKDPEGSLKRSANDSSPSPWTPEDAKKLKTNPSADAASSSSSSSPWLFGTGENIRHGHNSLFDLALQNDIEPWGQLIPHCALLKIFSYVADSDGILAMLYSVGKMNALWNSICNEATLWRKLDLSFGWIKQDERVLEQIIDSKNLSQLREINLSQWRSLTNSGIQLLADNCPQLTSVKLSGTRVNSVGLSYLVEKCSDLNSVDLSALKTDAPHGKALQHFLESRGSKVRSLNMSSNCLKNFNMMMKLISTVCPNLVELTLNDVSFHSERVIFDLECMQTGCPHLRVLRMVNAPLDLIDASPIEQLSSPGFPELQELDLGISNRGIGCEVSNNFLHRILKKSYTLKSLAVRGSSNVTCDFLQSLPIADLQRLCLSNCTTATYEGVETVMTKWWQSLTALDLSWNIYPGMSLDMAMRKLSSDPSKSKLEEIDLRGTQISCGRVQSILEGCPRLNCLRLDSCRGLPRGMKKEYSGSNLDELRTNIASLVADAEKDEVNMTRDLCIQPFQA